ncbi:MAG TPA: hypothetical protein VH084_22120 [Mycobacterium sp.]|jgi:hypothetical protein|nr:hypothetical protein [Mycobacterium sp.]
MARQVRPLQRLEGVVAVFVDQNAGLVGLLPHILDLQLVPGGISGDQDPSVLQSTSGRSHSETGLMIPRLSMASRKRRVS